MLARQRALSLNCNPATKGNTRLLCCCALGLTASPSGTTTLERYTDKLIPDSPPQLRSFRDSGTISTSQTRGCRRAWLWGARAERLRVLGTSTRPPIVSSAFVAFRHHHRIFSTSPTSDVCMGYVLHATGRHPAFLYPWQRLIGARQRGRCTPGGGAGRVLRIAY